MTKEEIKDETGEFRKYMLVEREIQRKRRERILMTILIGIAILLVGLLMMM